MNVLLDKLEIIFIAYNGVSPLYCFKHSGGDIFSTARPDACYDDLTHNDCKDSESRAENKI
jgi:hypothetical protein